MGSFTDAVAFLLEAYSKCLTLLQALKTSRWSGSDAPARLDASLLSDRGCVRQAYSRSLARHGAAFDRGDKTARSSLRRLADTLITTLETLVRACTGRGRPSLDYESLIALSSASSLDAMRTMTDLSIRVGSTASKASAASRRRAGPTAATAQGLPARGKSSSEGHVRHVDQGPTARLHRPSPRGSPSHQHDSRRRMSMSTTSSDSTKLGEVRLHRRSNARKGEQEPTYPLHPYLQRPEGNRLKTDWMGRSRR